MIAGIGVDVVDVERMRRVHARYGARFAARVLAPWEQDGYARAADPAAFLAKRFAVKEAAAKALGTGLGRGGVAIRDIGVVHDDHGAPALRLAGGAAARAARLDVRCSHLSVADERSLAIALVVLETAAGS